MTDIKRSEIEAAWRRARELEETAADLQRRLTDAEQRATDWEKAAGDAAAAHAHAEGRILELEQALALQAQPVEPAPTDLGAIG